MNNFKFEVANELGCTCYQADYYMSLTSKAGADLIGGYMVKENDRAQEKQMSQGSTVRRRKHAVIDC